MDAIQRLCIYKESHLCTIKIAHIIQSKTASSIKTAKIIGPYDRNYFSGTEKCRLMNDDYFLCKLCHAECGTALYTFWSVSSVLKL